MIPGRSSPLHTIRNDKLTISNDVYLWTKTVTVGKRDGNGMVTRIELH